MACEMIALWTRRATPLLLLFTFCVTAFALEPTPEAGLARPSHSDRATWLNIDVSPDGQAVVFDHLGTLFRIASSGGVASPFGPRSNNDWNTSPGYSPVDQNVIAFIGDGGVGMRSLWVVTLDEISKARRLSDDLRDVCCFAWRPDGRSLLAIRTIGRTPGQDQIMEYFLDGSPPVLLGEATDGAMDVAVPPTGQQISFSKLDSERSAEFCPPINIETMVAGSAKAEILIRNGFRPKYSPDGRVLAFARMSSGVTSLWVKDLRTGSERKILEPITRSLACSNLASKLTTPMIPSFQFTPDSKKIVVASRGEMASVDVVTGEVGNIKFEVEARQAGAPPPAISNPIRDTFTAHQLLWLDASGDGKRVVFNAAGKVYLGDIRNSSAKRINSSDEPQFAPAISSDGKRIAYVAKAPEDGMTLLVANAGGRGTRVLFHSPGLLAHLRWLPDRSGVVVSSVTPVPCSSVENPDAARVCQRKGQVDLVRVLIVPSSGGAARQLAEFWAPSLPRFMNSMTSVSADGQMITYGRVTLDSTNFENHEIVRFDRRSGTESVLATVFFGGVSGITYAAPSPNGKRLAIFGKGGCWIIDLSDPRPVAIGKLVAGPTSLRIGPEGSHASWINDDTLIWASGNEIYRWHSGAREALKAASFAVDVPRIRSAGTLVVTNVDIVTMNGEEYIKGGSIILRSNRIFSVSREATPAIPAGATIIDGTGKTIMPGIVDTHAHPHTYPARKWEHSVGEKPEYLASLSWGVTTLIDPQPGEPADAYALAELVAAGQILGPRIYTTGPGILSDPSDISSWANSVEDVREMVRQRKRDGAIYIKSYRVDKRERREAIVDEARKLGLGITTEGGGEYDLELTHVADGHTAVEHNLPVVDLQSDVADYIARSGVIYTPVLTFAYGSGSGDRFFFSRDKAARTDRVRRFSRPQETPNAEYERTTRFGPDSQQDLFNIGRSAHRIVEAGGQVAIGSHNWPFGLGAHWDLWLLAMSGFTPHEALRAATISGAEKLGLEKDLGSIETGKLADLIILNCNPLGDVRCTGDIKFVVVNGFIFHPDTMTRLYPNYRAIGAYSWRPQSEASKYEREQASPLSQ